jgi:hypothetical protein
MTKQNFYTMNKNPTPLSSFSSTVGFCTYNRLYIKRGLFSWYTLDKNNLELDVDIAGDLATLKENLAKFKKGKMKGLEDIDINELDWVRFFSP